jgi:hypothetical protein
MAKEAGRDPASIEITSFGFGEDLDRVKRLAEMGVACVVPMFPPEKADKVLPIIDRWTNIMRQVSLPPRSLRFRFSPSPYCRPLSAPDLVIAEMQRRARTRQQGAQAFLAFASITWPPSAVREPRMRPRLAHPQGPGTRSRGEYCRRTRCHSL